MRMTWPAMALPRHGERAWRNGLALISRRKDSEDARIMITIASAGNDALCASRERLVTDYAAEAAQVLGLPAPGQVPRSLRTR